MASITVEGIPDALLARLQMAAAGSGRSLNSEVIVQLVRSIGCSQREGARGEPTRMGARCVTGDGCRCILRRTEARDVGWGGPARP
ncbi:MAG TPA: hypothetical protein VI078_13310 [bacterium]